MKTLRQVEAYIHECGLEKRLIELVNTEPRAEVGFGAGAVFALPPRWALGEAEDFPIGQTPRFLFSRSIISRSGPPCPRLPGSRSTPIVWGSHREHPGNHYVNMYIMYHAKRRYQNRPDVIALIEEAAKKLTDGNKTEAVALAMRRLLDQDARAGSLFGVHRGSVRVHEDVDLIAPALDVEPDAETGREIERGA
jgi:hypothetical protein